MKLTLFFLATATSLVASVPTEHVVQEVQTQEAFIIDPPSNFYIEKDLDSKVSKTPGGTVTTLRYGPYSVPSMGMLDNERQYEIAKPCEYCYVVAMQGDLQFEDGRSAMIEDGAWLHHMVLYSGLGWTPSSKTDLVCSNTMLSLWMGWPHRIFASGNERTPVRLNTKYKFGIPVEKEDSFHVLYDLVNVSPKPMKLFVVMTYEWVPKTMPGYKPARMVWTDITGCGASEAIPKEGSYEFKSPGWTSTIGGVMLSTLGHVHDGGVYTTLYVNEKPVCRSDQFYGTKPAFFERDGITNLNTYNGSMGHAMAKGADHPPSTQTHSTQAQNNIKAIEHVTESSSCVNFGILRPGDMVVLGATYNTTAHNMNRNMMDHAGLLDRFFEWFKGPNDPKFAPIMGINPLYIGEGQMEL